MEHPRKRRVLVTLADPDALASEAQARGLRLAEYLRELIHTHPDRKERAGGERKATRAR